MTSSKQTPPASKLSNPQHPLWATFRFSIVVIGVTFILWGNASSFDETEIKTILEIAILSGGYEGFMAWKNGTG